MVHSINQLWFSNPLPFLVHCSPFFWPYTFKLHKAGREHWIRTCCNMFDVQIGLTWDENMHQEKKKLTMVIFLIFVQINIYIKGFQKDENLSIKGFWENAFFVFLHYRGIGVFWPKIPLNLTFEGLREPVKNVLADFAH